MDRTTVVQELHTLMDARLFTGPWLTYPEGNDAIREKLKALGLSESVPDCPDLTRDTALGKELQLDLLMVFLGLWDIGTIPLTLEQYGLIDETECDRLYADLCTISEDDWELCDPEAQAILRPVVQKAYRDHFHLQHPV